MKYHIDDFIVTTSKKAEKLKDKIAVPGTIIQGKPSEFNWENKTREFTIFKYLSLLKKQEEKYYLVISDMFVFIDLIEILRAFTGNKLNVKKEYQIKDNFTANIVQKAGNLYLKIHFKDFPHNLYLDKFECSSLAAKFSKILQRCEPWQEQDQ